MREKTITVIFVWSGRQVKVPARMYSDLKHLNARLLETGLGGGLAGEEAKTRMNGKKRAVIELPEDLCEEIMRFCPEKKEGKKNEG